MTGQMPINRRYSPFDRAEVHRDMRVDPVVTARDVAAQPAVAQAHRDCAECAELTPPRPMVPDRLGKVRLTSQQVSDLLGLQAGFRVLRMYVTDDPHDLVVVIEGDAFEPVAPGEPIPPIHI